jgi:RNA polymerase sigma factor (sigma-70 family)
MTELLSDLEAPSDAELISRVRGGDVAAYGDLFERHVHAANRLARQLVRGPDSDDLVSEAFAKVLHVLQGGGGPDVAFRAYLLTAVRRLHVDRVRAASRLQTTDDLTPFDPGVPFQDTAVAGFESSAAAKAFGSLPERWQLVLWHLEVEGQKPAEIAPLLGMSANSVSALAYRAREGLRQAFLTMHLSDISDTDCRWVNEHLGAFVRKGLSKRDTAKVQSHLDGCRRCTAMYLELTDVNSNLSGIIAPLLLGAAATGYLASSGTAGVAGVFGLVGRLKETVVANSGAATAGVVAAGVAAVAVAGFAIANRGGDDVVANADTPIVATTPAAPGSQLPAQDTDDEQADGATPTGAPGAVASVSPAAVLPVVAPTPSALPTGTAGDPQAGAPGAAPGSQPGSDPTDGAAGPSDTPTTDAPSPTDSAPADPTPTDQPAADVDTRLAFEAAPVVTDGHLAFRLTADTVPPEVTVTLEGGLNGIEFATGTLGACTADGTVAICRPTLNLLSSGAAGLPAAVSGAPTVDADLPLRIPDIYTDSSFKVVVSVPDGFTVGGAPSIESPATYAGVRDFDFATSPLRGGDDADRAYTLSTDVAGVPAAVGSLDFAVSAPAGADVAVRAENASCSWSSESQRATCDALPGIGALFTLHLDVTLPDTSAQTVAVRLVVPSGWTDSTPGDTTASITLDPAEAQRLALATGVPQADGPRWNVPVTVTGYGDAGQVTFTLVGAKHARFDPSTIAGCVKTTDTQIVCAEPPADGLEGQIAIHLPPGQEPETVEIRVDAGDEHASSGPIKIGSDGPGSSPAPDKSTGADDPHDSVLGTLGALLFG